MCAQYLDAVGETPYNAFAGTTVAWRGATVMLVFMLGLVSVLPVAIAPFSRCSIRYKEPNYLLSIACALVVLFVGVFCIEWGEGRITITNTLYEYSVILLIVGLYYASDDKRLLLMYGAILLFRIYIDFSTGNRVTSLEMMTAVFLMRVSWRVSYRTMVPIALVLFVLLMMVGSLRGDSFSFKTVLAYFESLICDKKLAWDGAYSAYHSSLAMLASEMAFPYLERILAFPAYLLSLTVVPANMSGLANPTAIMQSMHWNMGGTYFPFYFHFYLGLAGVLITAVLLGMLLRFVAFPESSKRLSTSVGTLTIVWIAAAQFRWIQYEPTSLLRGAFLMSILSLAAQVMARFIEEHDALRFLRGRSSDGSGIEAPGQRPVDSMDKTD